MCLLQTTRQEKHVLCILYQSERHKRSSKYSKVNKAKKNFFLIISGVSNQIIYPTLVILGEVKDAEGNIRHVVDGSWDRSLECIPVEQGMFEFYTCLAIP